MENKYYIVAGSTFGKGGYEKITEDEYLNYMRDVHKGEEDAILVADYANNGRQVITSPNWTRYEVAPGRRFMYHIYRGYIVAIFDIDRSDLPWPDGIHTGWMVCSDLDVAGFIPIEKTHKEINDIWKELKNKDGFAPRVEQQYVTDDSCWEAF